MGVQGYKLFYREESQSESPPVLLRASEHKRTVGGLGELRPTHGMHLREMPITQMSLESHITGCAAAGRRSGPRLLLPEPRHTLMTSQPLCGVSLSSWVAFEAYHSSSGL